MAQQAGKWKGGRVLRTAEGALRYQIRKMVAGKAYSIVLDVRTEEEAELELRAFLADPVGYSSDVVAGERGPVELSARAIDDFRKHLVANGRTERYSLNVATYLAAWHEALGNTDLRGLDRHHVLQPRQGGGVRRRSPMYRRRR